MSDGFGIIFLILFILFLFIGRAITMWYTGTGEIVSTQKQIIQLLTDSLEAQRELMAIERDKRIRLENATARTESQPSLLPPTPLGNNNPRQFPRS